MTPPTCAAVLVVEDERDVREAVVEFLELEGFEVHQAENGKVALEVLRTLSQPTLILADMMMPVMDGASFIAALRNDDRFAALPVVIVSALDSAVTSGHRHLKKPIDMGDLLRTVEELCSRCVR